MCKVQYYEIDTLQNEVPLIICEEYMSKESSTDSSSEGVYPGRSGKKQTNSSTPDRPRRYVSARDRLGDISWKISSLIDPKERMQMVMDLLLGNPARNIRQTQMFSFAAV